VNPVHNADAVRTPTGRRDGALAHRLPPLGTGTLRIGVGQGLALVLER
jgi:hypothetical protein